MKSEKLFFQTRQSLKMKTKTRIEIAKYSDKEPNKELFQIRQRVRQRDINRHFRQTKRQIESDKD